MLQLQPALVAEWLLALVAKWAEVVLRFGRLGMA
jgi:hypothetical protein